MEFSENFERTFNDMKNNKTIVAPLFLFAVILLISSVFLVKTSGILEFSMKLESAIEQSVSPNWSVLDFTNITIWGLIIAFFYLHLICTFYLMVRNQLEGMKVDMGLQMQEAFSYIPKFIMYRIIWIIILVLPTLIAFGVLLAPLLVFAGAVQIPNASVLLIIAPIIFLLYIAYTIFVSTRLIFSLPELFLKGKGPLEAFKISYGNTAGHFKQVFILLLIIFVIGIARSVLTRDPFTSVTQGLMGTTQNMIITIVITLIAMLLGAIVLAFGEIYLFHNYKDFVRQNDKKRNT